MPGSKPPLHITGLRELRRALKDVDKSLPREVNAELKDAARPLASDAARRARRDSGRMAGSTKSGGTAKGAFIAAGSNAVPYAGVHEFGGTITFLSRQGQIHIDAQPFLRPAADEGADELVEDVGDRIERLAHRHGF